MQFQACIGRKTLWCIEVSVSPDLGRLGYAGGPRAVQGPLQQTGRSQQYQPIRTNNKPPSAMRTYEDRAK